MKYLKVFENFNDIDDVCRKYNIENYTINEDGSIDVDGDVDFTDKGISKIPLRFNIVSGVFNISYNNLITLEGCPKAVGEDFYCYNNQLTSLEGGPEYVGGGYSCQNNQLVSLKGCCESVGGNFTCSSNKLVSLEFGPISIDGDYDCSDNQLKSLKHVSQNIQGDFNCFSNQLTSFNGGPEYVGYLFDCRFNQITSLDGLGEVGDFLELGSNPIDNLLTVFKTLTNLKKSMDYSYLRGTSIDTIRFKQACDEIGVRMPDKIKGYNYI